MPQMNDLVPSIGVGVLAAEFLADDAVVGEGLADQPPHRGFRRAVGGGDRIEAAALGLVFDPERRAEEWQDGFPGNRGEPVDEGREIDGGHAKISCGRICRAGSIRR
jgi:hypothetical protein